MKAIAVDDEPIALDIIRSHASKVPFLDLKAEFTDAFKALEYLQREAVDLIFLDIKMPDISGIDFFNSLSHKPLLIFTTAYSGHAVTSFEMDAVDYLLKPIPLARFIKACNKANELHTYRTAGGESADYTYIKSGYDQFKVWFNDIRYLEATGNYVTFVLSDKKILSRNTISEVVEMLPRDRFVRVHRSWIAAIHHIDKVERDQLLIGGAEIPISDSYRQDLKEVLKRHT